MHHTQQTSQPSIYQRQADQTISNNPQRYVYIDPGRQSYINPAHIQCNQNYYQSPIIHNPPFEDNASLYGLQDPYTNYYTNYYGNSYQYGNCGCYGQYANYGQAQYGYARYLSSPCGSYSGYYLPPYRAQGCGCHNCAQYGLSINRERLTPKFPQKLRHSFITSGDRVEDKLVINQPTVQSAPFQTQRRKTYVPYTRKYIEYQDYIQYVPVQKSQWAYQKIMKQIDFVPQQYYETSVQVVPRERLDHRVQYLPVQHQIVHVPQDKLAPPPRQGPVKQFNRQNFVIKDNLSNRQSVGRRSQVHFVQKNRAVPIKTSGMLRASDQPQLTEIVSSHFQKNDGPILIRPDEFTVQMVPNSNLQHSFQQAGQTRFEAFGKAAKQSSYQFPTSGEVLIGSSSQIQSNLAKKIFTTFGPTGRLTGQAPNQSTVNIKASQVVNSNSGNYPFRQNRISNPPQTTAQTYFGGNYRQSQRVDSQDYRMERLQNQKRMSIVNKFDEE